MAGSTPVVRAIHRRRFVLAAALLSGCGGAETLPAKLPAGALPDSLFAALAARVGEPGGYFDTDNLISNEAGYLKVMDALAARGLEGGAYVGVGPDQNFSYIAQLRPALAFIVDIRRDNLLHRLLLKTLMEEAPTRVEYLAALHGRLPPPDPSGWDGRTVDEILDYVEGAPPMPDVEAHLVVAAEGDSRHGVALTEEERATIRRFHRAFVDAGPALRFTSRGRPPRCWYYPTYRQLLAETDVDGDQVSYLADEARYRVVRRLQLENRVIPAVGDLAGPRALREIGTVLREFGLPLHAFYVSNVEFYLWRAGTMERWLENLRAVPAAADAVVIRSIFLRFGRTHPSAVPGYYAAQSLQPVSTPVAGGFTDYRDLVMRGVLPLTPAVRR
ncbi:MAG: hypothetical protein ACE5GJ_07580 [Gemmatimonadota bacterium]